MQDAYYLGATAFHIGTSAVVTVNPPQFAVGGWLQKTTGAGTLWLAPGVTLSLGVTQGMWLNTDNKPFEFWGPAQFFIFASGATATVGLGFKFAKGLSSPIAGG